MKNSFDKLGIKEAEQKYLAGVSTQYESEVVYHSMLKEVEEKGIIFLDTEVNDASASLIVAQLLFLEADDPDKDRR